MSKIFYNETSKENILTGSFKKTRAWKMRWGSIKTLEEIIHFWISTAQPQLIYSFTQLLSRSGAFPFENLLEKMKSVVTENVGFKKEVYQ